MSVAVTATTEASLVFGNFAWEKPHNIVTILPISANVLSEVTQ